MRQTFRHSEVLLKIRRRSPGELREASPTLGHTVMSKTHRLNDALVRELVSTLDGDPMLPGFAPPNRERTLSQEKHSQSRVAE